MSILELKNVTKSVSNGPKEQKILLDSVNFTIRIVKFLREIEMLPSFPNSKV